MPLWDQYYYQWDSHILRLHLYRAIIILGIIINTINHFMKSMLHLIINQKRSKLNSLNLERFL